MNRLTIGIVAHVDAGKTTLSEALLFTSGAVRRLGRVDNRDAFLDTDARERARGITVFSKQAVFSWQDRQITLLDTPGHVDFSAETERVLQVLDYAVLVISGADGVQAHTRTLWWLLSRYRVPVFLFVNKMDQPGTDREKLMEELKRELSDNCEDFHNIPKEALYEAAALCDEAALEEYLDAGCVGKASLQRLIRERRLFPCYFGSALKLEGVEDFLDSLCAYALSPVYPRQFGARVFKITRDGQGNRLSHMKITGGSLAVKEGWNGEKADQIRIYSGEKYETVKTAEAGSICAVTGLEKTRAGDGLGGEPASALPILEPVLSCSLQFPEGCDPALMLSKLSRLEEEEPQLHVMWDGSRKEIRVQIMGEVQTEILQSLIRERFGVGVEFGPETILYRETIADSVEGVGHFEPLRHYAEVHLLLEPGERDSGLQFDCQCSEELLPRSWQRTVLTCLQEKEHRGVLTGAPITDMRITLTAGRAHRKHTEGGDFRQAGCRAVRQGLMQAQSVLLEPFYRFRLEVPQNAVGRAMTDIEKRHGRFDPPLTENGSAVLTGYAPAACLYNYGREVNRYTGGEGRLFCAFQGYEPCHNTEEVVRGAGYDPQNDTENPCGSIFCDHGAGFYVNWDCVEQYMHLAGSLASEERMAEADTDQKKKSGQAAGAGETEKLLGPDEVEEILNRAMYANSRDKLAEGRKKNGALSAGTAGKDRKSACNRGTGAAPESVRDAAEAGLTAENAEAGLTAENAKAGLKAGNAAGKAEAGLTAEKAEAGLAAAKAVLTAGKAEAGLTAGKRQQAVPQQEYLLVDGYNIIFAWEDLRELAETNLDGARGRLLDMLSGYQAVKGCRLIAVFDAYRVRGHETEVTSYQNILVVFTREAETADRYIEKFAQEHGRKKQVTVATSDGLEQIIIRGKGCALLSARELREEMERTKKETLEGYLAKQEKRRNYLLDALSGEEAAGLNRLRMEENRSTDR